jgi:hypothetical protein
MRRQECTPTFATCFPTYVCAGHHVRTCASTHTWNAHRCCVHTPRNGQLWILRDPPRAPGPRPRPLPSHPGKIIHRVIRGSARRRGPARPDGSSARASACARMREPFKIPR